MAKETVWKGCKGIYFNKISAPLKTCIVHHSRCTIQLKVWKIVLSSVETPRPSIANKIDLSSSSSMNHSSALMVRMKRFMLFPGGSRSQKKDPPSSCLVIQSLQMWQAQLIMETSIQYRRWKLHQLWTWSTRRVELAIVTWLTLMARLILMMIMSQLQKTSHHLLMTKKTAMIVYSLMIADMVEYASPIKLRGFNPKQRFLNSEDLMIFLHNYKNLTSRFHVSLSKVS